MNALELAVAEVLVAHRDLSYMTVLPNVVRCSCGWTDRVGFVDRAPFHASHVAAAVVAAQREAATITTVKQLEALPDGAVVLVGAAGIAWQKGDSDDGSPAYWWTAVIAGRPRPPLPAMLLWNPEWVAVDGSTS